MLSHLPHRFPYLSLYSRIVLGNSLIIVLGAVGGTLLTSKLSGEATNFWLIVFFSVTGTAMCLLLNSWIVRKSLQPLDELQRLLYRVAAGQTTIDTQPIAEIGPDLNKLASALNTIVSQLEKRNQQLGALSSRAIQVQEDERVRIARSLHDETGQSLSILILQLDRLDNALPADEQGLHQKLAEARNLAANTLAELRKIIYDLRPSILDDLGLVAAIRWYARKYLEAEDIQVQFNLPKEDIRLPGELTTTLFRISQEAINNVVRHACARVVTILLIIEPGEVCLQVIDDGQGFDMNDISEQGAQPQKLGLLGIQERAGLFGGKVIIETSPGNGVRLQVCLPLLIESVENTHE